MPNRKNLIYIADNGDTIKCRNIAANGTEFGFIEDLTSLKTAKNRPKGLKFLGVYATAKSMGGITVNRFFPVGNFEEIYVNGGTIKQSVSIEGATETLTFTVTAAKGESRRFIIAGDPGGPAPAPVVTSP